jgi:hypothetical protein
MIAVVPINKLIHLLVLNLRNDGVSTEHKNENIQKGALVFCIKALL